MTIKEARKRAGMTQEELAERIGKTKSSVQKYEAGQTVIPISVLKLIAGTLGVSLAELLDITPEPQWIPVSERLPTARQSVILSTKDWTGEGCYWETTEHHVIWKGYRWNATYWDDEVIAWMPLPEPYREDN